MTYEEFSSKLPWGALTRAEKEGLLPGQGNNYKKIMAALNGYNLINKLLKMEISFFTPSADEIEEFEDYRRRKVETLYKVEVEQTVVDFCKDVTPTRRHWTTETFNHYYFVTKDGKKFCYNFCHYTDKEEKCYKVSISAIDYDNWLWEYYFFKKEQLAEARMLQQPETEAKNPLLKLAPAMSEAEAYKSVGLPPKNSLVGQRGHHPSNNPKKPQKGGGVPPPKRALVWKNSANN